MQPKEDDRFDDDGNFGEQEESRKKWNPISELLTVGIYAKLAHFNAKFCSVSHEFSVFLDGKYHVLPSGDLHIFRVEENDASVAYSCRVRNSLTNLEESSPPFHLAVDSEYKSRQETSSFFSSLQD